MALEPYVRRRWPQTLISWSAVLIGRVRDAVVGRDVLIGCAAGVGADAAQRLLGDVAAARGRLAEPRPTPFRSRARAAYLALVFLSIPHAIREALFFFFLIFLLRAVLRNQWAGGRRVCAAVRVA